MNAKIEFSNKEKADMARDMTQKQFEAALKKRGMWYTSIFGYVNLGKGAPGQIGGCSVHPSNGGKTRREQLAYLIREQKKYFKELEELEKSDANKP